MTMIKSDEDAIRFEFSNKFLQFFSYIYFAHY